MGNSATVIFTDGQQSFSPAVYLHWNGGPESVYGFLEELNRRKVRSDQMYECARFIQLVGEFFDRDEISGYSLGVTNGPKSDSIADLQKMQTDTAGQNGFYLVNRTTDEMSVRRFIIRRIANNPVADYRLNFALVELTLEEVAQEKAFADGHEYRPEFREFYAKLTANKKE